MKTEDQDKISKSLKLRLSVIFGVAVLLISSSGYWFYRDETKTFKDIKYDELKLITDYRATEIVEWLQAFKAVARQNSTSTLVQKDVRRLIANPNDQALIADVSSDLQLLRDFKGYENAILSTVDGRFLLSLNSSAVRQNPDAKALVALAAASHKVVVGDFFRCHTGGDICLDAAAPLVDNQDQPFAVLLLRTNLEKTLYPMIQFWPFSTKSGETLLVKRDGDSVLILNRLRNRPSPPLTIRIPISDSDIASVQAAMGKSGRFEGKDYRGATVLADLRHIPGTPWFLVAKVDTDEIFAETRHEAYLITLLTIAMVLFSAAFVSAIYKKQGKSMFQALYRSERQRAEAQKEFRTTFYSIGDAVITTDVNGCIRQINPVAEKLTGWMEAEGKGHPVENVFNIINETSRKPAESPIQRVLQEGVIVGIANHTLLIARDGTEIPIADSAAPIRDAQGHIVGVVLVFRDQTQQRETQKMILGRLRLMELASTCSLEQLLQKMLDEIGELTRSPIGFCRFIDQTQKTLSLQAWSTRTMEEFCDANDRGSHYEVGQAGVWADCYQTKTPLIHNDYSSLPNRKGLPEGHIPIIREMLLPIVREERIVAILGVGNKPTDYAEKDLEAACYISDFVWEIIEKKQAEKQLRESETRFRRLYEQSPVPYQSLDARGHILEVNAAWLTELGYARKEAVGKWFGDLLPGDDAELFKNRFEALKARGEAHGVEFDMKRADGSVINVIFEVGSSYNADGSFAMTHCVLVNVTKRKQAEKTLRESQEKYRAMVENVGIGVALISPDLKVMEMNRKMREWFPDAKPEDCPLCYRVFNDPPTELVCENCPTAKTLLDGEVHEETRAVSRAGRTRNRRIIASPMLDAGGQVIAAIEMVEDITERLELESQLQQAQKMESIGRLAGGVAHDFNNQLSVISGYAELALMQLSANEPLHDPLKEIVRAANRSAAISRQLLAFARKQTIAPKVLDFNENIEHILKMLRRLIGENIDLAWAPASGLWPVKMDPTQLDQILTNLCVNAKDAISGVGKISIGTGITTFDEAYCADHKGFIPGAFVMLTVSDDGCGMDKDTLKHVFEPFFTTKEQGKGTGLGLATVYGIVKQNKGFINVYSEPGKGTTFKIYLPRHFGKVEKAKVEGTERIPSGNGELVLLVEDEPGIIRIGQLMLEKQGYRVMTASTASQALKMAETHKGAIDLLITDVIMPEMSGKELSERLKQAFPEIKLLFMSGYTADAIAHQGVLDDGVHFLQKPFSIKDLVGKVREAMDTD